MIAGSPDVAYHRYVAEKHLRVEGLRGLSLGCGTGARELLWAETGVFGSIHAFDISEKRIQAAVKTVQNTAYRDIIHYEVADAHTLELPAESYDVVIFDHSLHHFSSLDSLLRRVGGALVPGGLVVANEFVGPSRFQWTGRQLQVVNDLLRSFPREYTTLWDSDGPRVRAWRPGRLTMWLSDPSEAVESSEILTLLREHFDVLEERGYGGAILHLLFSGIAHHFINPGPVGERLLELAFRTEDALLRDGEVGHDFMLTVARKRG
jgi:SAM-dependent methyltransferase